MINTYDNRTGSEDVWVVTHDNNEVFQFTQVLIGQLVSSKQPHIDHYIPTVEGWQDRLSVVIDLMYSAETSGLPIPIPTFLKTNMNEVISYINEGSDDLKTVFETSTDEWLDMRVNPDEPTPREMALSLL